MLINWIKLNLTEILSCPHTKNQPNEQNIFFFMEYMHFKKAFYFCVRWLDTEIQLRATVDMFLFLA